MTTHVQLPEPTAEVIAVQDDLVTIAPLGDHPLIKNEVVYIIPHGPEREGKPAEYLKAEVLRVRGKSAEAQVFESTTGVRVGDQVVQSGEMLSVALGPGLLSTVFDGLQNPLAEIASEHGFFLPRGVLTNALDATRKWAFTPKVKSGDAITAGDILGTVPEGRFEHKIMAPFTLTGAWTVERIREGSFTTQEIVATLTNKNGQTRDLTLVQHWPVRRAIPDRLVSLGKSERLYPSEPLITTIRLIDTFFPIARGGMGCIPGPFGAGKTVLQSLISRFSAVNIVIVVACGERAGEVVETITEFPHQPDPSGDGTLMDRTVIVCNTSSMPVAAREASIYTGLTLGEYYRQMGYDVLLIADSTSRWAQAMRETSGRLEEIPGEEAFPAYLDSSIKGVYERAGVIRTADGDTGSLTMIGTVSPAGGNFEEPVTQSTLGTVKTFLGLSADRAYKRFYPAVDPLLSWSRYPIQLENWFRDNIGADWASRVEEMIELLQRGDEISRMMQVTGEEGISTEDFVLQQKALFLDMVYLQQDAFDGVDISAPLARQQETFDIVYRVAKHDFGFDSKDAVRSFFTELTSLFKNLNYAAEGSQERNNLKDKIESTLSSALRTSG
ncbi:V/A-type H+-transporting ATPase subunit A [Roseibium hamelinense]|uniref:V-type ATP synthase alpha chain n=1 Tax=Roseibium hamelinense TaxID=150831 RepID=A0A562SXU7_9HYPH|nr:V-type ATP synthase subunit A [Roseibium hamelinense]MTI44882.1 V-type ATP synthase subunit A [Roseibium hamelinense]TWI85923.1 V/A-type H+-transporting ATPase subunit A [Roseibium hamelinense]